MSALLILGWAVIGIAFAGFFSAWIAAFYFVVTAWVTAFRDRTRVPLGRTLKAMAVGVVFWLLAMLGFLLVNLATPQ